MGQVFRTSYFDEATTDLPSVIEQARRDLIDSGLDFDTLVGTGFSGAVVIPALAMALGKDYVLVRKEGDDSHHGGGRLVGILGERWLFVDDFTCSGSTRNRVIEKINYEGKGESVFVGSYLYINAMRGAHNALQGPDGETL